MRKFWLLAVALFLAATPMAHAATEGGAHWKTVPCYGGTARCVQVYDMTTDANTSTALRSYVSTMNILRQYYPALPYLAYVDARSTPGYCGWYGDNAQTITVCNGNPGANNVGLSRLWWVSGMHLTNVASTFLPGQTIGTERTTVCHEMGHALGLDHNLYDPASCMKPSISNSGYDDSRGYSAADISDLVGLYYSHYPN